MDVRLLALLLALLGVLAAIFLTTQVLLIITGVLGIIVLLGLAWAIGAHTSGELGMLILLVGGPLCILAPMWIIWLIRAL